MHERIPALSMAGFGRHISEYETKEVLGQGGFAIVYRATSLRTGKEVAIKKIDKELMISRKMEDRVLQEIKIHSRLDHPSVLGFYTYFEDEHYVYLVLELCHNGELQRYLKSTKAVLDECDTATILRQVIDGLLYLHSHQIMHRDLSLTNLLLTKDMHVKIADFGLATQLTRPDEKHLTMCGTPNYISPEVATNRPHGLEVDVWSIGIITYTMLIGKPPFDNGGGAGCTITRVANVAVQIPNHLSYEAQDLLRKLLNKNPNERFKLQDILNHEFMRKNSPVYLSFGSNPTPSKLESNNRWFGSDSGLASSYLTSGISLQPTAPHIPVNSTHVPVINGAHRKLQQQQQKLPMISQQSQEMSSATASCCNGHFSTNPRRDDCSHCNPSISHGHICHGTKDYYCQQSSSVHNRPTPKISIPPIVSHRLLPVRQKTKNVIVNILDNGEVCLEFIKTKDGQERVTEVLRISPDGMKIVLYQPHRGKGVLVNTSPPSLPNHGADHIFTYENLPEKHWKKYSYAAKFVDLVKSKTPKVTFYSKSAKCFLMENGPDPDFEACFYEGGKITKSGSQVKLIESNGKSITFDPGTSPRLSPNTQLLWEHFEKCWKHCQKLEATMEGVIKESEDPCFPMVVGRRPQQYQKGLQNGNKENLSPQTPSIVNVRTMGGYESSIVSTSSRGGTHSSKSKRVMKEFELPGIGTAAQYSNGDISVIYSNGSKLVVNPNSPAVSYVSPSGQLQEFKENDLIPSEVKNKLSQMPTVLSALMSSGTT